MPRRTIFVRDDDLEGFEAIPDRPKWLHRAIEYSDSLPPAPDEDEVEEFVHTPNLDADVEIHHLVDDGQSHAIRPDVPMQGPDPEDLI